MYPKHGRVPGVSAVFLVLKPLQKTCSLWDSHDCGVIALTAAHQKVLPTFSPRFWAFVVLIVTICIWRVLSQGTSNMTYKRRLGHKPEGP
jgi:hypothetical protein